MPRPTKLLPGEELTIEAFNAEIDRTRKQLSWVGGSTIQSGTTGGSLTPMREIKPVWGRLTGEGPDRSPDYYQWEEIYPDVDGKWTAKTGDADTELAPNDSLILSDVYGTEWIINPAVEVNDIKAPIGKIVRLIPTENFVEEGKGLRDNVDDYWMHRHWLFSWEEQLRPFKLTADLIPTGGTDPDLTIEAEWLDDPGEDVTLYPVHRSGWPAGDQFISLGIGRGAGAYFRGTYGWAHFQPKGTIIGLDSAADPIWRPEWQIVTLYAETIAQVTVTAGAKISSGDSGDVNLFWIDKNASPAAVVNSGYDISLFNDLPTDLSPGHILKVYYDRNRATWVTLGPQAPSGISIRQSAGQNTTAAFVTLSTDVTMHSFGIDLLHIGNKIKNVSEIDLIVLVSWQVCAQRDLSPVPVDIDAVFRAALYNDGTLVSGTESQLSSSRRIAANEGNRAVNTLSGSVIQKLAPEKELELKIRDALATGVNDLFSTIADQSHLTVTTIPGVVFNP